jgi:hypothetical protein
MACSTSQNVDCSSDRVTSPRYLGYVLAAFVVGLVVISPMAFLVPVEKALWAYSSWNLGDEEVISVSLLGEGSQELCLLEGTEAGQATKAFLAGTYCTSNRDGQGPSPRARVSIAFAGGKTVEAAMWPDGRFEVSELGTSYLVSAPGLQSMVQEQIPLN